MKKKYETELLGAIHETAVGLKKIGTIDSEEMREYDEDDLIKKPEKTHPVKKPTELNPATA